MFNKILTIFLSCSIIIDNSQRILLVIKITILGGIKIVSEDYKLTRGTKELIKQAIQETQSNNRYLLCEKIAEMVENKYGGLNLEYQLKRMNIQTTGKILQAIDTYFYKHLKSDF